MEERDLYLELRLMGIKPEDCEKILNWTETLPIHISTNNTNAYIKQGIIKIEPNYGSANIMKTYCHMLNE